MKAGAHFFGSGPQRSTPLQYGIGGSVELNTFVYGCIPTLGLAAKTVENYLGAYRRYIQPALGDTDLSDITRHQVQAILQPLPSQSAYQALMMLKTVFREAHAQEELHDVPTDRLKSPRVIVPPQPFLTWERLQGCEFGSYESQIRFLALHGLRWSEAQVLNAADISDGLVHIWHSARGATKSASGVRSVPYLGHFAPFPKDRRTLARVLSPYGVTIHSLRKTYAYLLKTSGVHVSTAQRLMGHSSIAVTLGIYTQVLNDEVNEAGTLISQRITST